MTLALAGPATRPLDPVCVALDAVRGDAATFGVTPGLTVRDPTGWLPATSLTDGTALDQLLDIPVRAWGAKPHAAAALAYKQYTYWLVMPAVLGWATVRRVPLVSADNVLVRCAASSPYVRIGLRRPTVAVCADDPAAGAPGTVVVGSPDALLDTLRETLLDQHVAPLVAATRARVRIGAHTLYGQLAASVAYVLSAAGDHLLDPPSTAADTVLAALGLRDLAALRHTDDGLTIHRNTCCLAFVVPALGRRLCPNCCIPH